MEAHRQPGPEPEPVARVRRALAERGVPAEIRLFPSPLATAAAAAAALGVEAGRIAKSVVLVADDRPVLVVAAGDRRVDLDRVGRQLGAARVRVASPEQVLALTGFTAGGVAPVGWRQPAPALLDASLQRFPDVWAGAGVPEALVRLRVEDLPRATGGRFTDVTRA